MIILTGAQGFIGKKFLEKLTGKEVIQVEKNDSWHFRQTFSQWNDVELILHQGAISSTTCKNLKALHHFNVEFSEWLFEEAIKREIPVKYASSASVYGNMMTGVINPLNYYAISKVIIDYWVQDHMDEFSSVQGFRYFNVYGQGEDHKGDQASPVQKFTQQIKETGKLKLFKGSDKFKRDFICVDDIVDIVLNNNKPSGIYDLGTGNPTSFQKVAELIATKYNGEIEYVPFPDHLNGKYQSYTCAHMDWLKLGELPYHFTTVEDYVKNSMD
jgi:ADP-L-glycero-D-manno-heptose 6-epimerase